MLHSDALRVQQLLHAGFRAALLTKLQICQRHLIRKHLSMTRRKPCPPSRSIFDAILGRGNAEKEREVPLLVAIDPESDGGLGGTSEDLFGPLVIPVCSALAYMVIMRNVYCRKSVPWPRLKQIVPCRLFCLLDLPSMRLISSDAL